MPTWIFSVVASVRCEVQANDQSWSSHRLAFTLPDGERDTSLEFALEQMSPVEQVDPDWPALDPAALSEWIGRALNIELAPQLSKIKERQQLFLRRELNRIDEYFENYARELRKRTDRQHKEEAIKRYADRLEATRLEHNRRRIDQVERHTIHVLPHVDALLTVAESAFAASVTWRAGREERIARAVAETVMANFPVDEKPVWVRYELRSGQPIEVDLISIFRTTNFGLEHWQWHEAGEVHRRAIVHIQRAMDRKALKLETCLIKCDECWLLLVAPSWTPAGFIHPDDVTLKHTYTSGFHQAWLLDDFSGDIVKLNTISPARKE